MREKLYGFFESWVDVARVKHGSRQTVEGLISEEALLLAKYLRNEREAWIPRVAIPNCCARFITWDYWNL